MVSSRRSVLASSRAAAAPRPVVASNRPIAPSRLYAMACTSVWPCVRTSSKGEGPLPSRCPSSTARAISSPMALALSMLAARARVSSALSGADEREKVVGAIVPHSQVADLLRMVPLLFETVLLRSSAAADAANTAPPALPSTSSSSSVMLTSAARAPRRDDPPLEQPKNDPRLLRLRVLPAGG